MVGTGAKALCLLGRLRNEKYANKYALYVG
jgi:hypothetical protein